MSTLERIAVDPELIDVETADQDSDDLDLLREHDLDEYVRVMVSLRGGARPILCW
jgi:hypothetical protein